MIKIFTTAFLLFLQGIRESIGAPLNTFFMNFTDFGNLPIILFFIAVIYWSYDKKLGEYLLVHCHFPVWPTVLQNLRPVFIVRG